MKKVLFVVLIAAVAGAAYAQKPADKPAQGAAAQSQTAQSPTAPQSGRPKPESVNDRASYIIGYNLGKSMKQQDVTANTDLVMQGLRDGMGGGQAMLSDQEMQEAMTAFQKELFAKQEVKQQAAGEKNKQEGEAFLAANKSKKGVVTTASGLQYEIVKPGSGDTPKPGDKVTVNYKGTLIDGTVFDSSVQRGQPATFPLNGVVKCWTEGMQQIKVGGKAKIICPSDLAYGDQGRPPQIKPGATLVFEVELLEIVKDTPKEAPKVPAK